MTLEAPRDATKRRILESLRCFVEAKRQLRPGSTVFDFSDQMWEQLKDETQRIGWLKREASSSFLKRKWSAFNCAAQAGIRTKIARAGELGADVHFNELENLVLELNNQDPSAYQRNRQNNSSHFPQNSVSTACRAVEQDGNVPPRDTDHATQTQTEEETEETPKRLTRRSNRTGSK